jgi:two-component system phosphate regulon sensor histidine kinase PhoR
MGAGFRRVPLAAQARAEQLLHAVVEGIITFDASGRITFFNQGAERITGWTAADAAGQPLQEVLKLTDAGYAKLVNNTGSRRQIRLLTRDERPATLAVTSARLAGSDDAPAEFVLVIRDVTDEDTGRHLHSYFLANISHEFRTPLAGLNASIELLLDEGAYLSPAEMDELLNSIHLSASGLQALVDNLLESVNIEAGHFTIHRRPTELSQVLADAIRMMQPLLDRRRQALTLTGPLQLPSVTADPTRLTQVLINLLSNASKYSPLQETIDLTLVQVGDALRVSITDRGPGIPPDERGSLFRRFVRLDLQDDDEQVGMGLGLSVVKAIIEEHRGEVGIEERPGGGSIFWFTLPLGEAA